MVRFKEIEVALGGALSKSQSSGAEKAQCYTSFRPKVVHDPSSELKVAQRPAQGLLQQTKPLQLGLGVEGATLPNRSLPSWLSVNSIRSSALGGDRTIGTWHNTIAPALTRPSSKAHLTQLLQIGPMQRVDAGLNQSFRGVPSIGVNSIQESTYVGNGMIGTKQNTVAPRHHFLGASGMRPLFEERIGHPFFSGPPSLALTGLGGSCGPFSSAGGRLMGIFDDGTTTVGSSSEMSMFTRLASHRSAKSSIRLDSTTVYAARPEGYCNPLDGFRKLDSLEAAWAARRK